MRSLKPLSPSLQCLEEINMTVKINNQPNIRPLTIKSSCVNQYTVIGIDPLLTVEYTVWFTDYYSGQKQNTDNVMF